MCERDGAVADQGAALSKGAMSALQQCGRVVATFIDPLTAISHKASSEVCRFPIPKPILDINALCTHYGLHLPGTTLNPSRMPKVHQIRAREHHLATIKLILGYLFERKAIALHTNPMSKEMQSFLDRFKAASTKAGTEDEKLKDILKVCREGAKEMLTEEEIGLGSSYEENTLATEMLIGFEDSDSNLKKLRDVATVVLPWHHRPPGHPITQNLCPWLCAGEHVHRLLF
jgi:hypothetical protein